MVQSTMKETDELVKAIIKAISEMTGAGFIDNLPFDKTYEAVITSKTESTYRIKIGEAEYEVEALNGASFSIGDIIKICVPQGKWSGAFILGKVR